MGQPHVYGKDLAKFAIPLPPLGIQKEIVEEINKYQKIIEGSKVIVKNWKPEITIDPNWPLRKIKDIVQINPSKPNFKEWDLDKDISFLPMSALDVNSSNPLTMYKKKLKEVIKGYTYFQNNDVLLAKITPCFENGKSGIVKNLINGVGIDSTEFIVLRADKLEIDPIWIWYFIFSDEFKKKGILQMTGSAGQKRLPISFVENYEIPVPNIEIQKTNITTLQINYGYIKETRQVILQMEKKIEEKINEVWGE